MTYTTAQKQAQKAANQNGTSILLYCGQGGTTTFWSFCSSQYAEQLAPNRVKAHDMMIHPQEHGFTLDQRPRPSWQDILRALSAAHVAATREVQAETPDDFTEYADLYDDQVKLAYAENRNQPKTEA